MKKTFAIFLAFCLCIGLCACGATQGNKNTESNPAGTTAADVTNGTTQATEAEPANPAEDADSMALFEKYLGSYLDSSHYHTGGQGLIYLNSEYTPDKYNYLPADGYIVIGDQQKVTTGKTTLNDLLLQGWELGFELTDEHTLAAHYLWNGYSLERDGKEITIGLLNDTDETIHLKDAQVNYIVLDQYVSRDNYEKRVASAPDFLIDGKIDAKAGIQTIVDAFGEPTDISFTVKDSYAYMDIQYNSLHFRMSLDGNTLYSVSWY